VLSGGFQAWFCYECPNFLELPFEFAGSQRLNALVVNRTETSKNRKAR